MCDSQFDQKKILKTAKNSIRSLHIRYSAKGRRFLSLVTRSSEQIFGYNNLKINIWYLSGSLKTYINQSYSSRIDKSRAQGATVSSLIVCDVALDIAGSAKPQYAFIGYMTVYKFYAYPANLRPRLSQVVILPPFRNMGHATELLHTFYRDFVHVPNVCDITGGYNSPIFTVLPLNVTMFSSSRLRSFIL
ncbi:unnamed protein product [Echinostoma caproni]|uniref:Hat1_N domain-containing protein n=1 Tax=Echinostoma caproni TaxID=27848 RepID=A0A182ZZR1_9TREM|nr:unnamed protein product [Echinostoma caproni]